MAMIRCPQCNAPLTDEEAGLGACPLCAAAIERPVPKAAPKPTVVPPQQQRSIAAVLWAIGGALVFCLLPVGMLFYHYLPDKPEPKEEQKLESKPDTDDSKKPDPKKTDDDKKEEPKQPDPKVAPKKIDEAKKPDDPKPKPVVQRKGIVNLPFLSDDAIKIDGDLADWKGIAPVLLNVIERGPATKKVVAEPKALAYLAYCPKGILVAVDVVDTSGELEIVGKPAKATDWAFWDNDAVEIFIDTLNTRPGERGLTTVQQFFSFPFGTPNDGGIAGYESRIFKNAAGQIAWTIAPMPSAGKNQMRRAAKKTRTGWAMEILIPKSALRPARVIPGQVIGFELQIGTGTNIYYQWANDDPQVRVSANPSKWGEATLAGTDAVIELLGADQRPVKSFTPGQALTLRVTDADRNLDPARKEKINVMLVSRSGDRKTVLLEETEPNSGIFVGGIATRLSTGRREANVFEVQAGESIVAEYLDPINASCQRNVLVRANFTVQSR